MAAFEYIALNNGGKRQKGVLEADTARQVRQQLREKGLTPLEVKVVSQRTATKKSTHFSLKSLGKKRVGAADLALITRQMATLLAAGIPIDDVLTGVSNQTTKPHIKSILLGVRAKVMEGHTLAAGMSDFPEAFPKLYRTTIASGEKSGKLDLVLLRLAEYTEKQHHIHRKIRQALIYPAMMTIVSISVVVFLLIYVVPKIVDVFSQTNQALPMATIVLIGFSTLVKRDGLYFLGAMLVAGYFFTRWLKNRLFVKRWTDFY